MWFISFVWKNIVRRRFRSGLTIVAIALAIGAFLELVGAANGFERSFLQLYEEIGVDMIVVRTGGRQRINSSLDEELGAKIRQIPHVREIVPGLVDVVSFTDYGLYSVVVQGWVPETVAFHHLTTLEGRSLLKDDAHSVILGTILAKNLEKKVGDQIELIDKEPFTIVGIYQSGNVYENGALVVPLKELQRIMDRGKQVTGFSVLLDDEGKRNIGEVRKQIEALAPGLTAMSTKEHVDSLTEIKMAQAMAWMTAFIAILIGSFGMVNTMMMSVNERTREIGILRAVGWGRKRVMKMILLESITLSILGATLGAIGATILLKILTHVPAVNGLIDGKLSPLLILYSYGIAIGVGLIGGLIPALRATRMEPIVALRYE